MRILRRPLRAAGAFGVSGATCSTVAGPGVTWTGARPRGCADLARGAR
jgi:hypothetical protein